MDIEQSWLGDCIETLALLKLYGQDGKRYEDSRVVDLLQNVESITGPPRATLLLILRGANIDWLKDQDGTICL